MHHGTFGADFGRRHREFRTNTTSSNGQIPFAVTLTASPGSDRARWEDCPWDRTTWNLPQLGKHRREHFQIHFNLSCSDPAQGGCENQHKGEKEVGGASSE